MAGRRFEVICDVTDLEAIAVGRGIRELGRLRKRYGRGRWRKMKGVASIRLAGTRPTASAGKEVKRKRYVPES